MEVIKNIRDMVDVSTSLTNDGVSKALVPTMGFFHEGHLSLMREAGRQADKVIVTLFVNPTQFGPGEDLERYPRDLERDISLAEDSGADFLFTPLADSMYSLNHQTWIDVEKISQGLCGKSRPGHFRGVATVVAKLLNIVRPEIALFGKKDFQQLQIIKQMVKDLNMQVKIIGCPIVREPDGLAMSSRNKYLSGEERKTATVLFNALLMAEDMVKAGNCTVNDLKKSVTEYVLSYDNTKIDYIFIGEPDTLEPLSSEIQSEILLAMAVYIGNTRLLDNTLLKVRKSA